MSRFTQADIQEVYEQDTVLRLTPHRAVEAAALRQAESRLSLRLPLRDLLPMETLAAVYRIACPS